MIHPRAMCPRNLEGVQHSVLSTIQRPKHSGVCVRECEGPWVPLRWLRRVLVEWRVAVLQSQSRWQGEAVKRLRVSSGVVCRCSWCLKNQREGKPLRRPDLFCTHCKKRGHQKSACWQLHPDMHPRSIAGKRRRQIDRARAEEFLSR